MSSKNIDIGFCDKELIHLIQILSGFNIKTCQNIIENAKTQVLEHLLPKIRNNNTDFSVTQQYETCELLLKFINQELQSLK